MMGPHMIGAIGAVTTGSGPPGHSAMIAGRFDQKLGEIHAYCRWTFQGMSTGCEDDGADPARQALAAPTAHVTCLP